MLTYTNFSLVSVTFWAFFCCAVRLSSSSAVSWGWRSAARWSFPGDVHSAAPKFLTLNQGHIHGRSDTLLVTCVPSASFTLGTIHDSSSMQLYILSLNMAEGSKLMGLLSFFFFLQASSRCQEGLHIDINHYPVDSPEQAALIDQNRIQ